MGKEILRFTDLDNLARIHQRHAVCHVLDHGQIVSDQHHGHAALCLKVFQQFQHLRLKRHVQSGRWLIGNQQVGLAHQGHGNHHTLQLPARELKGILLKSPVWLTQTNLVKPLDAARPCLEVCQDMVPQKCLLHLLTNSHHRVEAARWLLKDDGDAPTSIGLHLPLRELEEVKLL